jgi:hypothetical protein
MFSSKIVSKRNSLAEIPTAVQSKDPLQMANEAD